VAGRALSSVYFYFDPQHTERSLGTFGAITEIKFARLHEMKYYYLGYWIADCVPMNYKCRFTPHELLDTQGIWRNEK
jgi:arginine-tRNA-protein transferase